MFNRNLRGKQTFAHHINSRRKEKKKGVRVLDYVIRKTPARFHIWQVFVNTTKPIQPWHKNGKKPKSICKYNKLFRALQAIKK